MRPTWPKKLWNSEQESGRNRLGVFAKFCTPVVANGKVYMATFAEPASTGKPAPHNKLVVYGVLNGDIPAPVTTGKSLMETIRKAGRFQPICNRKLRYYKHLRRPFSWRFDLCKNYFW